MKLRGPGKAGPSGPAFIGLDLRREEMFRKVAFLFLVLWLLPACGPLAPFFPPLTPPVAVEAESDLFQRAESSYRHQAYQEARQRYAAYLERYPQGRYAATARLKEAEVLGLLGDWGGALRSYQALLARDPQPDLALKARYGSGRAYFKLGQYQQATQVLDNLTAVDLPRSLWFSTQALLGEIALKQGQVPQAFSRLRLAAQVLPAGDQEWFEDLKIRVLEQATPGELQHLATLYRDSPLSAALLLRLVSLALEAGQADEAQQWLSTLRERFPASAEAAAGERLLSGGKVLLGCLLPLSGDLGHIGDKVKRGMELAAREAQVELLFRDTRNDPGLAAPLIRELAQEPRLLAILGPLSSGVAQAAAEAAQASQVPLIALSQKAGLTQTGDHIFQAFLTPRQQVKTLLRGAWEKLGIKRYAAFYPDSSYGRTFLQEFQEGVAARGGEVAVSDSYVPGTRDFVPLLSALRDALGPNPEGAPTPGALFVPDDAATVAALAGQLADTTWRGIKLLSTNLVHNPETLEQARALEGVWFPDAFFAGDPDPGVQRFMAAYRQQYGEEPDYLAAQGYVVVRVLSDKSLSRTSLPRQLLALKRLPDLPWFHGFTADREAEPALYLLTFREGRVQMASPPRR